MKRFLAVLAVLAFAVSAHAITYGYVDSTNTYSNTGAFVVKTAQPYKTFAWALLDKQKYPDMRQYPGGPPVPPYDNAAWALPLQMGVLCDKVVEPFEAKLEMIGAVPYPKVPAQGKSDYFILDPRVNASYAMALALLKDGAEISRTKAKASVKGRDLQAGAFVVKNSPAVRKALPES